MTNADNRKVSDALSELLGDPGRNARYDIWLWLHLQMDRDASFDPSTCGGLTMRDEIAFFLKTKKYPLHRIAREKDQSLIPDESLAWIDEDERQHQWLLGRIEKLANLRLPRGLVHLTGRKLLIALIDSWDAYLEEKSEEIELLRREWLKHKAKDSAFEWFAEKKESASRCACAWEWLVKDNSLVSRRTIPITNYKELLMFFDGAELGRNEQKAIINEIKKRWNRKQLDVRNPDKKQLNVMIPIAVIAQLDELAAKHKLKRPQVIERLITGEFEAGIHLDY
ncbi:hypothetical protein [Ectopseudomonas mendocina]|uniref:hypothetical protein n=1 Tax=Ectopseudomonas mendocina TaxID=300 RepID=UPI0023EB5C34|nr:hypothetical protein [Pseudomonas mendocina]